MSQDSPPRPIDALLSRLADMDGTDLFLTAGAPPVISVGKRFQPIGERPLAPDELARLAAPFLDGERAAEFAKKPDLDLACSVPGKGRFRLNIFRQRGSIAIVARRVKLEIPSLAALGLPPVVASLALERRGLLLVTGATGSGKSTTLAAMIDHRNSNMAGHIVTIEDPIEYLLTDKKATINQREIGIDVLDFKIALRALVRENPDIVLVGEMRDKETFEAALNAAETGHLVYGTIHASSTTQTFSRIYGLFDPEEREQVRKMLAYQMRAFVYQKLLPTLHENIHRIPAIEILINNSVVQKHILEGREGELREYLNSVEAVQSGMKDFNQSLVELVEQEYIHMRVAMEATPNPDELMMRLKRLG